jgi:glycosyltransferase involved in cell wall biosynthesis
MKILIINQHPTDVIGGSEIQSDLIATYLTRFGHEVVYLAVNGAQQTYDTPYRVEPKPLTWKALRQIVVQYRPEIALWRFSKNQLLLSAIVLRLMKVKMVFSVANLYDVTPWSHKVRFRIHSFQMIRALLIQLLSSRINHFGYYLVDGVIAQTAEQTQQLPVRKEIVIANSADPTVVPFSWPKPFVIWVANLKPRKNPEAYLELAKHFQQTDIDFLIVGELVNPQYKLFLDKSHLPSNVHYLGTKTYQEVNGIIQQSLCLVHTTYGPEGFPNVFIQAWLQGKPVVSLYCDPDHLIQDYKIGYLSGNSMQLLQDTTELIANISLREEIGQRAMRFAEAHFNAEQNVRKYETFLQEICGKRSAKS